MTIADFPSLSSVAGGPAVPPSSMASWSPGNTTASDFAGAGHLNEQVLHLVIFTDTFFETNGISSYYRTLLDWCRGRSEVHATIICPWHPLAESAERPCEVVAVKGSIQFRNPFYRDLVMGYFSMANLRRIVERLPGRKVVHLATAGAMGVSGGKVARRLGLPLVACYHTDLQHYGRVYGQSLGGAVGRWFVERIALTFEHLAYARCDAMYVPSATSLSTVKNSYRGPIRVIPNPVDENRLRPAATREGRFRDRYRRGDRVLAVVVGRVAREKNLDLVCELLAHDERIDLVFVGDGPYAAELRRRWGVRVTGFLRGAELLEAYQQADLLVQLSVSETFGLSLVEALACGLPAIVLRSPGFVSTLADGSGVEVLEAEALATLADRCVQLVSDPARHREASRRVRELVRPISAEAIFPQVCDLHEEVLGAVTARRAGRRATAASLASEVVSVNSGS